jgi:hypothetical protein
VIFLGQKFTILLFKKKVPKQHDQEMFLEIFQKNRHISRRKVMYLPNFWLLMMLHEIIES